VKRADYKKSLLAIYDILYKAFGPQHWWPGDGAFEVAVGAILTQNTNWSNVERAIDNLKSNGHLNAKALYEMPVGRLASLIRPAGYFNIKAKRLKAFIEFLIRHYRGSMRRMGREDLYILRDRLLAINGIGPETADSILLYALGKPIFVVDAYTKRVLHRHGIVEGKTTYHEIQGLFHKNLPRDVGLFNEFHALFVRLGKEYCRPRPVCKGCPLEAFGR
jgi:endonuclease-3 related protein